MGKKNKVKIIGGILVLVAVIILCILYPVLRNKNNNTDTNNHGDYKIVEDFKYEYIESYEDYVKYKYSKSKSHYFSSNLTEDDFKNKKYLMVEVPYDPCGEKIEKSKIEVVGKTYNAYLDVDYLCTTCAPATRVIDFEVDKTNLDVEVYSKEKSHEDCE